MHGEIDFYSVYYTKKRLPSNSRVPEVFKINTLYSAIRCVYLYLIFDRSCQNVTCDHCRLYQLGKPLLVRISDIKEDPEIHARSPGIAQVGHQGGVEIGSAMRGGLQHRSQMIVGEDGDIEESCQLAQLDGKVSDPFGPLSNVVLTVGLEGCRDIVNNNQFDALKDQYRCNNVDNT